ncbi:MAG: nucleotidyl transferase AbiEii/AbiGii toxin family protein, partial [Bifidobacteriaceae bacterium]|nr:nucleotidyl transferase AbiEii/AbiGii toxin family protein [Bifidobacteriaceae bacterium]
MFLLKGGTLLQHRLNSMARTTKDVDGLVRGDMDAFLSALEKALAEPWGPLTLRRGPVETIDVPTKAVKPRRFDIFIELKGVVWRRVQFEASPDEAGIGDMPEQIEPTPLRGFGLPAPEALVGIALRFQIGQKLHAASGPHGPPEHVNDRARDVVDLVLLRRLARETGRPALVELRHAGVAVFEARAREARQLGRSGRDWPPRITAHAHWAGDYLRAAASAGVALSLAEAVAEANSWIAENDAAVKRRRGFLARRAWGRNRRRRGRRVARGESTAESDIDLAAVAPAAWEGRHALRDAVKRGFGNACDVLVLDEDRCFSESEP